MRRARSYAAVLLPALLLGDGMAPAAPTAAAAAGRPNFVFILADDFSFDLIAPGLLARSMPNLQAMMSEGLSFGNYFVTDSLCCPSRSSIFTGKLPHNTGVLTNNPPQGGFAGFNAHGNEAATFAVALQRVGYRTAMLGKYLNGYEPDRSGPPAGWSEWDVAGSGYRQFKYSLNQNGRLVRYGGRRDPRNYLTDVITGLGEDFIRKSADAPFFIEIATFSPHAPYVPAPRHASDFPGLVYDRPATFGARPDTYAPDWLKAIAALTRADEASIDRYFRMRVQSDQSIDDAIGKVRALLRSLHLERNTYVIFSSDNGYHMGEYSLRPGKMTPYDTDIHVPLVIVGPGIEGGRTAPEIVENVDLCPTITELAGASAPATPDGRSLVPLLLRAAGAPPGAWRHEALIEHRHPGRNRSDPDMPEPSSGNPPSYEALRTAEALYVEFADPRHEVAYYDLRTDPLELRNVAHELSPAQHGRWHQVLRANASCRGADACWTAQGMVP